MKKVLKKILKVIRVVVFIIFIPVILILLGFCIAGIVLLALFGWALMLVGSWPKKYIANLAISIDQLGNAIMLGDPDETISSRAGRRWPNSVWAKFINFLFWWEDKHVIQAIEKDEDYKEEVF